MRELVDSLPRVPRSCTWELTLRCNLHCGHCGSRAGAARGNEMPRQRLLQVARQLASLGCRRVTLSGGEPTLSEHWSEVASEGARAGMRMNLITNGLCASRQLVREARDAGLVNLGVSLDGPQPVHDRLRRAPGLYARVMQLLDDCASEGFPIGVITTIQRSNLQRLEELHDLLQGRVFVWQLQLGAAMGHLADDRGEQLRPEDLLQVVPTIATMIRKGTVPIRVADNVGYYGPYEQTLRSFRQQGAQCWTGCLAGCRNVGIEADGGIKGCLSLQCSTATEGNVQLDALPDIWNRPGAFAYNRDFSLEQLGGFCRTCVHAAVCRGGCHSMRSCEGGLDNPFCYHRVATLADRAAERRKPRYVPMALAPAAILAAMGCGGSVEESVAFYGVSAPRPEAGVDTGVGGSGGQMIDASPGETGGPLYGLIFDASDGDAPDVTPHYGIPDDAQPEDAGQDAATWYGMDPPDADASVQEAGEDAVYLYGILPPPDQ